MSYVLFIYPESFGIRKVVNGFFGIFKTIILPGKDEAFWALCIDVPNDIIERKEILFNEASNTSHLITNPKAKLIALLFDKFLDIFVANKFVLFF